MTRPEELALRLAGQRPSTVGRPGFQGLAGGW